MAESAFGKSLESDGWFCVGAISENLASVVVKMFSHFIHFIQNCYKCTFSVICKDNNLLAYIKQQGGQIMEAVCTSETSVYFNETTCPCIPQGCHLHARRSKNLKYHVLCKDTASINCITVQHKKSKCRQLRRVIRQVRVQSIITNKITPISYMSSTTKRFAGTCLRGESLSFI